MNFTREPIIETVITPRDGCTLVIRNSKGNGQEDYFVDAIEVVSFGHSFFFRSQERPKSFLVPVSDYEVLELKETRMVLKNVASDRSIKIGGGKADVPSRPREEGSQDATLADSRPAPTHESRQQPSNKRDKRRRGRRGRDRHDHSNESRETQEAHSENQDEVRDFEEGSHHDGSSHHQQDGHQASGEDSFSETQGSHSAEEASRHQEQEAHRHEGRHRHERHNGRRHKEHEPRREHSVPPEGHLPAADDFAAGEGEDKAPSFISKLFPPPPTLIRDLGRYKPQEPLEGGSSSFEHPTDVKDQEDDNEE